MLLTAYVVLFCYHLTWRWAIEEVLSRTLSPFDIVSLQAFVGFSDYSLVMTSTMVSEYLLVFHGRECSLQILLQETFFRLERVSYENSWQRE